MQVPATRLAAPRRGERPRRMNRSGQLALALALMHVGSLRASDPVRLPAGIPPLPREQRALPVLAQAPLTGLPPPPDRDAQQRGWHPGQAGGPAAQAEDIPGWQRRDSVDRNELRRTVVHPYSTGEHLQYRGQTVHRQTDYRMPTAESPARLVLQNMGAPALGMVFLLYSWRMAMTFELSKHVGNAFARGVVRAPVAALIVLDICGAALALLRSRGSKSKLKAVLSLNAAYEVYNFVSNGFGLVFQSDKWKSSADYTDQMVQSLFFLVLWRVATRVNWFASAL